MKKGTEVRKLIVLAIAVAALLVVAAPALAKVITGTNGDDVLIGTNNRDDISGKDGDDVIQGRDAGDDLFGEGGEDKVQGNNGPDDIYGGGGEDVLSGGNGDDFLADGTNGNGDGSVDVIDCGPGRDVVEAERRDVIGSDCERVTYRN